MFFTYIRRELRRRLKQSVVIAAGLAVGIALVITVSSASAGVKSAQGQVLQSLYGVGTDMTVTKTATSGTGGRPPQRFRFGSGGTSSSGTRSVSRNNLRVTPGTTTLADDAVAKVSAVDGVSAASGALVLTDTSFSGSFPTGGAGGFGRGGSTSSSSSSSSGPSFSVDSFTVDGIAVNATVGPVSSSDITSGSFFTASDTSAKVAVLSSSYAASKSLKVGSTLKVGTATVKVIGIAKLASGSADVFVPLQTAQTIAGLKNKVSTIFVSASSATKVSTVATAVKTALPSATVSTSADLANEISGALSSASTLANSLGKWLSVAALAVAFILAGLLMMAAVSRRVREFGTLKAIGWRTHRIVAQVMGEGIALGIAGGIVGILLGIAGAETITAIAPSLKASVGAVSTTASSSGRTFNGGGGFSGGGGFGGGGGGFPGRNTADSVLVHLSAPLQSGTILIALLLAVAGGLVAGGFGAWRAARLRPAAALRAVQ